MMSLPNGQPLAGPASAVNVPDVNKPGFVGPDLPPKQDRPPRTLTLVETTLLMLNYLNGFLPAVASLTSAISLH